MRTLDERVIRVSARKCGVTPECVVSEGRFPEWVRPRHVAMWVLHRHFGWSLPKTARAMRRADHTTVLHAVRRVDRDVELKLMAVEVAAQIDGRAI